MIIGIDELHKLVAGHKLLENLSERELKNPEGCGFDLRIGEIFEVCGKGFLGVTERETPAVKSIMQYDAHVKKSFVFKPGTYHLMKTIEKINTPENMMALFFPRSTLFRSGLTFFSTQCAPGYCGELIFGLANLGSCEMEIELGARVCHVVFFEVKGGTHSYRGQWQGGRLTTKEREKQV